MFSILGTRVPGGRFLDLYAGTGAVGIEALSRGAAAVTFVESEAQGLKLLRTNLITFGMLDHADVRPQSVAAFIRQAASEKASYDVVFADPPYAATDAVELLLGTWRTGLIAPDGVLVIEQHADRDLPLQTERGRLIKRYDYGDTSLFVYGQDGWTEKQP